MNPLRIKMLLLLVVSVFSVHAQQVPDLTFKPETKYHAYPKSKGPVIILDEAHFNFHTLDGRYGPFGNILTDDGYVLKPGKEKIDSIELFTGSAFLAPAKATIITSLDSGYVIELPSIAGEFSETSAKVSGMHFANGAMLQYGKGRVVIFGEAAMFTAQLQGPDRRPMGMNQPTAKQNPQFLLNVIHWLDGKM